MKYISHTCELITSNRDHLRSHCKGMAFVNQGSSVVQILIGENEGEAYTLSPGDAYSAGLYDCDTMVVTRFSVQFVAGDGLVNALKVIREHIVNDPDIR